MSQCFFKSFPELQEVIHSCRKCPRLVAYRESVEAKTVFKDELYWRRPVSGFGDEKAWLLILGLAPAPHGGNRTGRVFTGDPSATFLMRALHATGFANQPDSVSNEDGLRLKGCYITPAVKCTPPLHKPTRQEFANCFPYFENEFFLLKNLKAVLALGGEAFKTYARFLREKGIKIGTTSFSHGACVEIEGWPVLYGAYHPSPRNTYTGKLTQEMYGSLFEKIRSKHSSNA